MSLDTSVVLRLLVGEPSDQYRIATRFLREQFEANVPVHVGDMVLAEAYFALQSFYQLPKKEALGALALFARHSGVTVSPVARGVLDKTNLASAKPGFVDRLIHGACLADGYTLVTFERAAGKLASTHVLQASEFTP